MATRNDLTVEFNESPRIIEVAQPSVELNMQDAVDTIRKQEDSFQGMGFKKLLNASGKEDLFGGVQVGITVAFQNALLSFEARTTPVQTGVVTGSPVSPLFGRQIIQDTSATFITNSVKRGSLVINFSDNSIADVVTIDSETQMTTKTLINGISNTYSNLDVYHVFNITQVAANGGNLTAVDGSQVAISAILPTAFTQVVLTASSSATLQNQLSLNHSTFEGYVSVDVLSGNSGTAFPLGTPLEPVDNIIDAKLIATENGFNKIKIKGNINFASSDVLDNLTVIGDNKSQTTMTFTVGCSTKKSRFTDARLTGTLSGALEIERCDIDGLMGIGGSLSDTNIHDCILETAGLQLSTSNAHHVHITNSRTGLPDNTFAPIDFNFLGGRITIAQFNGQIEIQNMTNGQDMKIFINSGRVRIAASCTSGSIHIHGDATVTNLSGVGVTVVDQTTSTLLNLIRKILINKKISDPTTGLVTIFDDDDVTALLSGTAYEDIAGLQTYRGQGADIQDRLT